MMVRLFIAIDIPSEIKENIKLIENKMIATEADIKFVKSTNFHLTLKFLGYTAQEKVEEIKKKMNICAKDYPPFIVSFEDFGCFPNFSSPRVIWVGIKKGAEELKDIAAHLDNELDLLGLTKEKRPFHGHLTIGRVKSKKNIDRIKMIMEKSKEKKFGDFKVEELILMQSILKQEGAEYFPLYKAALGRWLKSV